MNTPPSLNAAACDEEIALDLATELRASASRSTNPSLAISHAVWLEEIADRARNYRAFPPAVMNEIDRALAKFPTWPTDPLHALAVLGEEYGELTKAVLQQVYEPHKNPPDAVRKEAVQVAAMALRFLASIDVYRFEQCAQHTQGGASIAKAQVAPASGAHLPRLVGRQSEEA